MPAGGAVTVLGAGVGRRTAGERAGIPAVTHAVMLAPALGTLPAGGLRPSATAGPTFWPCILPPRDGTAGLVRAPRMGAGIGRLLGHCDQLARQARGHLQLPLGNQ